MTEPYLFEFGIPFPFFHINFHFQNKSDIIEPIKFPKSTFNINFSRTEFHGRLKVIDNDSYILFTSGKSNFTIIGKLNLSIYLSSAILKIGSTSNFIFIKTKKYFVSYNYKEFKVWDNTITDFCILNNLLFTIEDSNICIYKNEKCIKNYKYNKKLKFIRGYEENIIVVTSDNKIILINQYNILKGRLIPYSNTSNVMDIEFYKNYVVIMTHNRLIIIDYINLKIERVKNKGYNKFKIWNDLLIINYKRGAFKYYNIKDCNFSKTVLYEEIVGDFDIFDDKVFVLTRSGIYSWTDNRENFVSLKILHTTTSFFNTIFKEHNLYPKESKSLPIEYTDLGITELIKKDIEEHFTKNRKEEKTISHIVKNKKSNKKGGF